MTVLLFLLRLVCHVRITDPNDVLRHRWSEIDHTTADLPPATKLRYIRHWLPPLSHEDEEKNISDKVSEG